MIFEKVLLSIDLNDEKSWKKPLPAALAHAKQAGMLNVMTVVPDFGMSIVGGFFPEGYEKQALEKAQKALHDWSEANIPDGVSVKHIIGHGTVYEEILRVARELKCDLIVLGSHRPKAEDYLLGPNAARVTRHAPSSVLVVRD